MDDMSIPPAPPPILAVIPPYVGPIVAALLTAALGLFIKICFDSRARFRERQGLAASLAGEMEAYLFLSDFPTIIKSLRDMAALPHQLRIPILRLFQELPHGHPVFDRVADKIGTLDIALAREISKLYNVVSGMRLFLESLPSDRFLALEDEHQKIALLTFAMKIETHTAPAQGIIDELKQIAGGKYWRCKLRWIGDVFLWIRVQ